MHDTTDIFALTPQCPICGEPATVWSCEVTCGTCLFTESVAPKPDESATAFEERLAGLAERWATLPDVFVAERQSTDRGIGSEMNGSD